jgi:NitT/TauT family transport system substrate-binding protein
VTHRLNLTESAPALKFAPQYLAEELGFFAANDIAITGNIDAGPAGSWLADNLVSRAADIALGGIWLPLVYKDLGIAELVPFAAVCHRNPAILISRTPLTAPFSWSMLEGKRLLLSLAATSQWMFLEGVLQEHDVDVDAIRIVRDLHVATTRSLWRNGLGDFFLVEPSLAFALLDQGYAIATTMAASGGPVPWSVYYTRPELLEGDAPARRFGKAIDQALAWLLDPANAEEAADRLARRFAKTNPAHLRAVLDHFKTSRTWQTDTAIDAAATARYQAMMVRYGLLNTTHELAATAP